jgi:hypothetical protein
MPKTRLGLDDLTSVPTDSATPAKSMPKIVRLGRRSPKEPPNDAGSKLAAIGPVDRRRVDADQDLIHSGDGFGASRIFATSGDPRRVTTAAFMSSCLGRAWNWRSLPTGHPAVGP